MNRATKHRLALQFGAIASEAGQFIMQVYAAGPAFATKSDGSPVSDADRGSEHIIAERLARLLPGVPLLAEESFDPAHLPALADRFLLVDPLDGTREFISRNGEFTVNIALIDDGEPIVGCVYAPALNDLYIAGAEAFRASVRPGHPVDDTSQLERLSTVPYPAAGLRAVASRSHLDSATEAFLAKLHAAGLSYIGSSLKFCLIARGDADVYPRLAPTMEWDVAAGHAVLAAAGGRVMARDGEPLRYGKAASGFRNELLVAWGGAALAVV